MIKPTLLPRMFYRLVLLITSKDKNLLKIRLLPRSSSLFCGVLALSIFLCGCTVAEKKSANYPRKPNDTSSRKAGAAMLLYEQAENDMDVNENVIVIPPEEKTSDQKTSQ